MPARALHVTELQQIAKEKPFDIAFVCTKSYDTAWATAMIKQYLAPDGYVVSLQNCMNEETIAGVVGWGKTLGSIASSITVELHAPGQIHRAAGKSGSKHTVFRVGEVHGRITDRAKEVCGLLANADSAFVTENIWGERWSKLVTNVMGNGLSACTGLIGREVVKNDALRHFSNRLGSEAIRVGQALGYTFDEVSHLDPETWRAPARAIRRRRRRSTSIAWRWPIGRRRRAPPVDRPGHGQGPPHRDRVPQRLCRQKGRGGRHRDADQRDPDRHRPPRRKRRIEARPEAHHRSAAELAASTHKPLGESPSPACGRACRASPACGGGLGWGQEAEHARRREHPGRSRTGGDP